MTPRSMTLLLKRGIANLTFPIVIRALLGVHQDSSKAYAVMAQWTESE